MAASPAPIGFNDEGKLLLFGVEAVAEVWAIALVYFVQGILGISRLAVSFYYKDTLHLGPAELSLISSISVLPWVVKPVYGFVSDSFPLFGYKRRSYLVLSGLLGSISWVGMSALASCDISSADACPALMGFNPKWVAVSLVTASSLGLAFSDVLVDAIVVMRSRGSDQSQAGSLQSLCWSSASIGSILSAYASGTLVQDFGPSWVFALTAGFPLITAGVGTFIKETPVQKVATPRATDVATASDGSAVAALTDAAGVAVDAQRMQVEPVRVNTAKEQFVLLWKSFTQKAILLPVMFLVLWQSTPTSGSALFYFETNELGFKPEFLGRLSFISAFASLGGVVLYDQYLKRIPLRTLFKWVCITGVVLGMTPVILVTHANRALGLPDEIFAMGDDLVLTVLGQIGFMPVLVLAANICPPGVEASLYAALMSVNNLSGGLGSLFGGFATQWFGVTESDFTNLPLLLVVTNLAGLLPLPFLFLLPEQTTNDDGELVVVAQAEPEDAQQPGVGVGVGVDVLDVVAEEDLSVEMEEETLK